MTTSVKVSAHLSSEKEVRVKIMDGDSLAEVIVLQDGESKELLVYDGLKVVVEEQPKE